MEIRLVVKLVKKIYICRELLSKIFAVYHGESSSEVSDAYPVVAGSGI